MTLSTQGDLLNGGRINAGGDATFSTTGVFKNDTTLADYSTTDGELFVGGDGGTFGDRVYASIGGHLRVSAPTGIENNEADLQVLGNLSYSGDAASFVQNKGDATLLVGNTLTVNTGTFNNETDASMTLNVVALQTQESLVNDGTITADAFVAQGPKSASIDLSKGSLTGIDTGSTLPASSLTAGDFLEIIASSFSNPASLQAGGNMILTVLDSGVANEGNLLAGGELILTAAGGISNSGTIGSGGLMQLSPDGEVSNEATLLSGGDMLITGDLNNTGAVRAGGSLIISGALSNSGQAGGGTTQVYQVVDAYSTTSGLSTSDVTIYVEGSYGGATPAVINAGGSVLASSINNAMSVINVGGSVGSAVSNIATSFTGGAKKKTITRTIVIDYACIAAAGDDCTSVTTTEQIVAHSLSDEALYEAVNNTTALIKGGVSGLIENTGVIKGGSVSSGGGSVDELLAEIPAVEPNEASVFNNLFTGSVFGGSAGGAGSASQPTVTDTDGQDTRQALNQTIIRLAEAYGLVEDEQRTPRDENAGVDRPDAPTPSVHPAIDPRDGGDNRPDIAPGTHPQNPDTPDPTAIDLSDPNRGIDVDTPAPASAANLALGAAQAVAGYVDGELIKPSVESILSNYGILPSDLENLSVVDTGAIGAVPAILAAEPLIPTGGPIINGLAGAPAITATPPATLNLTTYDAVNDLRGVDPDTLAFLGLDYAIDNDYLAEALGIDMSSTEAQFPDVYAVNQQLEQALFLEAATVYLDDEWDSSEAQLQGL